MLADVRQDIGDLIDNHPNKERNENSLKQQAFGVPDQLNRPVLFRLGLFLGLNLPADLRTDKITRSFPDVLN